MSKEFPYSYIRGKIVKTTDAVIPIQSKVVQYGLGIFSGIRGQWNAEQKQLHIFRLKDHYERLKMSAQITGMKFSMTYKKFEELMLELVRKNKIKEDFYIRPIVYAASTQLTPRWDSGDDDLAIYMISLKEYYPAEKGIRACVSSWRRLDDDAMSLKSKICGSYANSAFARTEAVRHGYEEAIFLNRDGKVCEASAANIFGIKDGVAFTPPLAANNLSGITRATVIEIAQDLGIEVREQEIDRSMLYMFEELFFCGTAAKVSFVASVDDRQIGSGKRGPITKKIADALDDALYSRDEKYLKYSTNVY